MVSMGRLATIFLKVFMLVINLVVIILYRIGYGGDFLGTGGTWNLNEEKNADIEIIASGVFVGFFIYTAVQLIAICFKDRQDKERALSVLIMGYVGAFLWIAVGGTALHYWNGYVPTNDFVVLTSERSFGLVMGSLCIISGALYIADIVLPILKIIE